MSCICRSEEKAVTPIKVFRCIDPSSKPTVVSFEQSTTTLMIQLLIFDMIPYFEINQCCICRSEEKRSDEDKGFLVHLYSNQTVYLLNSLLQLSHNTTSDYLTDSLLGCGNIIFAKNNRQTILSLSNHIQTLFISLRFLRNTIHCE